MPATRANANAAAAAADPTRETAFALLHAVLDRRRPLEEALDRLPQQDARDLVMSDPRDRVAGHPRDRVAGHPRDRAAGHRLAAAVLRRLGTLDEVLAPHLRRAPPDPVRHILRLGAAGALLLDTPVHAAVSTSVALARSKGLAPFAGLVNAVLRRVAEAGPAALEGIDSPRLDTPAWLWASWGAALARPIAVAHQSEAPLDLSLAPGAEAPPGGETLPLQGSVRFPAGTRPASLPGYAEGRFWVQDAAASLPARLLHVRPGERVADLCAAPGGKTAQLAAVAGARRVTAVERDGKRLARLRDNLARLRLEAELVEADALSWQAPEPFDAVLLDAPCTATGTIRRHPDVARLKRPTDVATLAAQQDRLLEAAAAMLRPGTGRLVYAVCSLQPEEGPVRAAQAAGRFGLRPAPFEAAELAGLPDALTPEGWLRTHPALWPERGGMDGFFAARFVRA